MNVNTRYNLKDPLQPKYEQLSFSTKAKLYARKPALIIVDTYQLEHSSAMISGSIFTTCTLSQVDSRLKSD